MFLSHFNLILSRIGFSSRNLSIFLETANPNRYIKLKFKGKVVPMLNYAPRHENVRGSGGIAPRILNLGARRK
jgi:hypothetical protein